jgi:hypothetical protein
LHCHVRNPLNMEEGFDWRTITACRRSDVDSPRTESLAMTEDMHMRVVGRDNSWLILLVAANAARLGMYGP